MCDTLCAIGRGRTLFGKNSDRPVAEAQVVEKYAARPAGDRLRAQYLEIDDAGAYGLVGSRPTWLWGFEHGVNEHGVAIGNEKVWTVDDPSQPSPRSSAWTSCASASSAARRPTMLSTPSPPSWPRTVRAVAARRTRPTRTARRS